jgi:hypothetical protein
MLNRSPSESTVSQAPYSTIAVTDNAIYGSPRFLPILFLARTPLVLFGKSKIILVQHVTNSSDVTCDGHCFLFGIGKQHMFPLLDIEGGKEGGTTSTEHPYRVAKCRSFSDAGLSDFLKFSCSTMQNWGIQPRYLTTEVQLVIFYVLPVISPCQSPPAEAGITRNSIQAVHPFPQIYNQSLITRSANSPSWTLAARNLKLTSITLAKPNQICLRT